MADSPARKAFLASMTPAQAAANIASVQPGNLSGAPVQTITLSPIQDQAWGLRGATYEQQQAATQYMNTPLGQANAGAVMGTTNQPLQQTPQPQQQQPMPQQQGNGSFFPQGGGMVDVPQERGMIAGAGQDLLNLIRNPQQIGRQMQTGNVSPGLAAVGLGIDLAMPGPGVAEAKIARAGSRATFTNPRLLAKLTPEALEAIKKITTQTENYKVAGEKLLTEIGRKEFASTAASKSSKVIGEIASNSKILGLKLGAVVKILSKAVTLNKLIGIGIIGSLLKGGVQSQDEAVAFQSGLVESINVMRESGDPEQIANADKLAAMNTDLLDDFTSIWHTPFIWNANERKKINDFKIKADQIEADNNAWKRSEVANTLKNQLAKEAEKSEADRKILAGMVGKTDEEIVNSSEIAEAANDNTLIQRRYMEALQNIKNKRDEEEQRLYDEMQKELDRRYAESQKAEQRAYTQAQPQNEPEGGGLAWGGQW